MPALSIAERKLKLSALAATLHECAAALEADLSNQSPGAYEDREMADCLSQVAIGTLMRVLVTSKQLRLDERTIVLAIIAAIDRVEAYRKSSRNAH